MAVTHSAPRTKKKTHAGAVGGAARAPSLLASVLALAMLARPDPVAAFFRRTEGRLGPDHDLEY